MWLAGRGSPLRLAGHLEGGVPSWPWAVPAGLSRALPVKQDPASIAVFLRKAKMMEDMPTRRVLVVEDLPPLREHVMETLAELGEQVEVDGAGDGLEALARIDAAPQPYDVVVTDLVMPRMDGETLLRTLRQRGYPAPVIVLTAHGDDDHVVHCLQAGACDFLVKPVGIEELQTAVAASLQHQPRPDADYAVDFDPQGWFELSGGSDYGILYRFRRFLTQLAAFRLQEPLLSEVRLTIEELGRNAIEWGNHEDPAKEVRFSCRILPSKLILQIADQGEGFRPDAVPDPSKDPFAHIESRKAAGKRLGGYGVHLIRNLMDKVVWNSRGNVVVAIKYLQSREAEPAR